MFCHKTIINQILFKYLSFPNITNYPNSFAQSSLSQLYTPLHLIIAYQDRILQKAYHLFIFSNPATHFKKCLILGFPELRRIP